MREHFWRFIAGQSAPIRVGAFLAILAGLWLPIAGLLFWRLREDENLTTIATMGVLFVLFLVWVRIWGRRAHKESRVFQRYGLELSRRNAIAFGRSFAFASGFVLGLLALETWWGWYVWRSPSGELWRVAIEGLLSAISIALAEELVFRGWLLDELERDYAPRVSLFGNAIAFALLHFLKPLAEAWRTFPEFPGLVLLGLILVQAKRVANGRLGAAIGLHAGLVWGYYLVAVGELLEPVGNISPWWIGVNGNPIASVTGWLALGGLYLCAVTPFAIKDRCR